MRELHGYHGEYRRRARDAAVVTDAPGRHARDAPGREARDALKLTMLLDPEAREAERLRYEKAVDEAYHARHAAGQLKPQETKPEHAPPETRDRPATGIGKRRLEEPTQEPDVASREKPPEHHPRHHPARAVP